MKRLWGIVVCVFVVCTARALVNAELTQEAQQMHAAESRATLELSLDVLRAKLADIYALLIHITGGSFTAIESLISLIESRIEVLGACAAEPIIEDGAVLAPVILIQTAGITIDNPGRYCLANDLDASAVPIAIEIAANDVTLDLNSKTISGAGAQGVVLDTSISGITVKNGTLSTLATGISTDTNNAVSIINCTFINTTTAAVRCTNSANVCIDNCSSTASPISFDLSACDNSVISNCSVSNATDSASVYGFRAEDGSANLIENCTVESISTTGTDSDIEVAGFMLGGTETCSDIINCTVTTVTSNQAFLATPYGIKVQTLTGTLTAMATGTISTATTVQSIDWSPSGPYLALGTLTSAGTELQVYKLTDVDAFTTLTGASIEINANVNSVAWSPDGMYLAIGSADAANELKVYSFIGEALIATDAANTATINSVAWSPDSNYIAIGTVLDGGSAEVQIWIFVNAQLVSLATASEESPSTVTGVAWSADGQLLAVVNTDGDVSIYAFDGATLTLTDSTNVGTQAHAVSWSPHGNFIAVAENGPITLQVFPVSTSGLLGTSVDLNGSDTALSVNWSPDGRFIAIGLPTEVEIYQFVTQSGTFSLTPAGTATHGSTVNTATWSVDGNRFALGGVASGGVTVRAYNAQVSGATDCVIKECVVSGVSGGSGTGVGISASSDDNLAIGNISFDNDINYALLVNVYAGGLLGVPTLLQNN